MQYGYGYYNDYDQSHTGDPRQDMEYERHYGRDSGQSYIVPEVIKNFLLYFQQCIKEQNLPEIQNQYENGFNKLTDRFFKTSAWPSAKVIAPIVGNGLCSFLAS